MINYLDTKCPSSVLKWLVAHELIGNIGDWVELQLQILIVEVAISDEIFIAVSQLVVGNVGVALDSIYENIERIGRVGTVAFAVIGDEAIRGKLHVQGFE